MVLKHLFDMTTVHKCSDRRCSQSATNNRCSRPRRNCKTKPFSLSHQVMKTVQNMLSSSSCQQLGPGWANSSACGPHQTSLRLQWAAVITHLLNNVSFSTQTTYTDTTVLFGTKESTEMAVKPHCMLVKHVILPIFISKWPQYKNAWEHKNWQGMQKCLWPHKLSSRAAHGPPVHHETHYSFPTKTTNST